MPVGVVGVVITRFEDFIICVVRIVVADVVVLVVVVVNLLLLLLLLVNSLKDSRNENLLVKL